MKLFYSPTSPFVRKVLIVAHELGLADSIEQLDSAAHPVKRDAAIVRSNPLGQVPTLLLDDGDVLYDSGVICQYLQHLAGGERLLPATGMARFACLRDQALGDGILNAALLVRYERAIRPEGMRSADWERGQLDKIETALAHLNGAAPASGGRFDLAAITWICALGYLDFRLHEIAWRDRHPGLAAWYASWSDRPSVVATTPKG